MKHIKFIASLFLSLMLLGNTLSVSALDEDKDPANDIEEHTGYTFVFQYSATYFPAYDNYVKYSNDASNNIGTGDKYPMNYYLENYDYIYVPKYLADKKDDIICIFVTARYCRVTYSIDGKALDVYHYFGSDNAKKCSDLERNFESTDQKKIGNITYYKNDRCGLQISGTTGYSCRYDNSYFEFNGGFDLEKMGEEPFVKLYIDTHLYEKGGALYYAGSSGKNETGWKTINGHKYYFRKDTQKAVMGKKMKIDGFMYKFNSNGICKGKYTGYIKNSDGTKTYYKNGKAIK